MPDALAQGLGATRARVEGAEAASDVAIANYRLSVLLAFQAVEDQLATNARSPNSKAQRRAASANADRT